MNKRICSGVMWSHCSLLARLHETQFSEQLRLTLLRCVLAPGLSFIDRRRLHLGIPVAPPRTTRRGDVGPIRGKLEAVCV